MSKKTARVSVYRAMDRILEETLPEPERSAFSIRLPVEVVAKLDTLSTFLRGSRNYWVEELLTPQVDDAFRALNDPDDPDASIAPESMRVNDFSVQEFYLARLAQLNGDELEFNPRERLAALGYGTKPEQEGQ